MATQKELLDAVKVIKKHCEEHRAKETERGISYYSICYTCMLRNSHGGCGLLGESDDRTHAHVTDWDLVEPEYPKLFTY